MIPCLNTALFIRDTVDANSRGPTPVRLSSSVTLWIISIIVVYAAVALYLGAGIVDDSYIFLRYAKNILAGEGAVFNPGDRVEGYTSPLWLAFLTSFVQTLPSPPQWAVLASASMGALLLLLVVFRIDNVRESSIPIGGLYLATNPPFVYWSWTGMDTALFTLLFITTFLSFERDLNQCKHFYRTGAWLALTTLARM